jgi:KaiC/GvpD/RAD55 family RecA-like ATPase
MAKLERYNKSPIRAFDNAANGGLKAGEMGLVTSKKGVGKTAVLVQFGIDTLLNGKQLVHVSFDQVSSNVIEWYDTIVQEIVKNKISDEDKEVIMRNRTILNFNQDNFNLEKVVNTLNALKAGGIGVAGVVIDGVDFAKAKESDIQAVASYAKATKTKVWVSATAEGSKLSEQAPKAILPYFSFVVHLEPSKSNGTSVKVLKAGKQENVDTTLRLDSKNSLILSK